MSTHSYVGIPDPEQPGQVRLRYVHSDGYPSYMIPTLRAIWAGAAERDTNRLSTLLLAYDWDYLDPDTTDGSTSTPLAGEQLIPGVGMTLTATSIGGQGAPSDPVTVLALSATGGLDAQWIYLLDPGTHTVTAHTSGGDAISTEPLAS
ncbi:hypothetical protein BJY16_001803 [Actinoplanes octamycinicus]|uniref:Uncharacterized protein n=1 Tax=Actinoplanes octamycinicus TaxID=135948 RepID=A0A7W7GU29_9ACTN|nr:hypothetical protein [Actinoplanes octamycinicus]MBB4738344.1 hypothetical protein [Actinoplanes octamycinicus]GIE57461.1 hypothetical protein Aoc01nite_28630 [Actinoplanes octamycinicus]